MVDGKEQPPDAELKRKKQIRIGLIVLFNVVTFAILYALFGFGNTSPTAITAWMIWRFIP